MKTRIRFNYLHVFVMTLFCVMAASYSTPFTEQGAQTDAPTAYFCWTNQVQWAQEPLWPVTVSIMDENCHALASITVTSNAPFIITANLTPGEYQIISELPGNYPPGIYWDAHGTRVKVAEDGTLSVMYKHDLRHQKTMTPLHPTKNQIVTEPRPTLKWTPFPGAKYYVAHWFEEYIPSSEDDDPVVIKTVQHLRTDIPEYTFEEDVVQGRRYEWSVSAFDQEEQELAYWGASYFTTPTGSEEN